MKKVTLRILVLILLFACHQAKAGERELNLEWENIEGASAYEIELTKVSPVTDETESQRVKSEEPQWTGRLNHGKWKMRIRAFDEREVPGEWSEPQEFTIKAKAVDLIYPKHKERVQSQSFEKAKVKLQWKSSAGAVKYKVKVFSGETVLLEEDVENTQHEIELPINQNFVWQVIPIMADGVQGEGGKDFARFTIVAPRLSAPKSELVKDGDEYSIKWTKPEYGQYYIYKLSYRAGKKWNTLSQSKRFEGNEIELAKNLKAGNYRFVVAARSEKARGSKPGVMTFKLTPKEAQRRLASIPDENTLKASIQTKKWYGIASYFITQINYVGVDRASGVNPVLAAVGGTGRLGLGYDSPKSNLGYYGMLDMSGFNIDSNNFTFASAELHATWKKTWITSELRLGGGIFMKELTSLQGSTGTGLEGVGKVTNIGPHIGAKYYQKFSEKLGMQAKARLYYSAAGSGPQGEEVLSEMSYEVGLLGSYELWKSATGFAGIVYRQDKGSYSAVSNVEDPNSLADPGETSYVEITGTYLNFVLEYRF